MTIDSPVEVIECEPLDVLGGINTKAINTDYLDQPLGITHQVAGGIFHGSITGHRIVQVELVNRDIGFTRLGVVDMNRVVSLVRVELAVV